MIHELKIWPLFFNAIWTGVKPWEVRKNDRGFREGDLLHLREWDPQREPRLDYEHLGERYTGRSLYVEVVYIVDLAPLGMKGFVGMTVRRV